MTDTPTPPPSDLVKLGEIDPDLIGRLRTYFEVGLDKLTDSDGVEWSLYCDALRAADHLAAFLAGVQRVEGERDALRKGIEAIKRATIAGRVCDDVAWFDDITTLHDFCDGLLSATEQRT